ncbi:uncharacterized protein LOC119399893 isoform X2 [Rhipicephalus sanguineus]|uniref:uncharacterized protein LOC119399893 isoform X2 n=1 Tax=Rhipicephalus sanguineus TaxID=34632 RepID=UPI001893A768|nr:uncharacterized protein LOC119399893 isoform X2 [Rhipicephalus sanguineus]
MTTNVALSLMLAHVCWVHCSGQSDYSRIPTKDQKYMEDARRLLEGRAKLFLERGVNGIIDKNKRICWTSKRMVPSSLGYHHTLQFFDRGGKGSERKQKRDTYWYVGLKDSIPSVLVNAYDKRKLDPEVSGDYILYFARPTCFLVGNETAQAPTSRNDSSEVYSDRSTCQLWYRIRADWEDQEECMAAFFRECSKISGTYYRYRKGVCNSYNK